MVPAARRMRWRTCRGRYVRIRLQGAIGLCDSRVQHNTAGPRYADQRNSLTAQWIATSVRAQRPVLDCTAIGLYGTTQV